MSKKPDPAVPPPLNCAPCRADDHEGCDFTVADPDGQWQACACRCGGGLEAWTAE